LIKNMKFNNQKRLLLLGFAILFLTSSVSEAVDNSYPLNPVREDTVASGNFHFTAGVNGPNGILGTGLEASLKYELLISHPYILRTAFELGRSKINDKSYPIGDVQAATFAVEGMYYRGTDKMTAFMGIGIVYVVSKMRLGQVDETRNLPVDNFSSIRIKNSFGYRLIVGARLRKAFSIEIGITEIKTDFIYVTRFSESSFSEFPVRSRLSNIKLTFGYLIPFSI